MLKLEENKGFFNTFIKIVLMLALGFAGYVLNKFSYDLAYGVSFSFGGIAVGISILILGPIYGSISALIAASITWQLYHHPYSIIIWSLEALFAGLLYQKMNKRSLLLSNSIFWILGGAPLVYFFYHIILHNSSMDTLLILLKQALNGIINIIIAEVLLEGFRSFPRLSKYIKTPKYKFNDVIFNLAVGLLIFPAILFIIYFSKNEVNLLTHQTNTLLNTYQQQNGIVLSDWYKHQKSGIKELARIGDQLPKVSSTYLQTELKLIKEIFQDFHNVYLADEYGTTYAFYPPKNDQGESTIGLNFSDRPYFKRMKESKEIVVSDVFIGRGGVSLPIFTISSPMYKNEKFKGFALGAVNISRLEQKMQQTFKDADVYFTLIDQNNRVISSNFPKREILTTINFSDNQIKAVPKTDLFMRTPPKTKQLALIAAWKRSFYFIENYVDGTSWKIIIEKPVTAVQSIAFEKLRFIFSLTLFFIYLSIFMSYLLSKNITSTVQALAFNTQQGQINATNLIWPHSKIEEFSMLSNTLKQFKFDTENYLNTLSELNNSLEEKVRQRTLELASSEERYRTFIEKNNAPMLLVDSITQKILEANVAAAIFYGWSREELKEKYYFDINVGSSSMTLDDLETSASSVQQFFNFQHKTASGEIKVVQIYSSVMTSNSHPVIFAIIHDVSEKLIAEKLIEEQRIQLNANERMALLIDMAGGVAHEINNPLAVIYGKTIQMKRSAKNGNPDSQLIIDASDRIFSMVERIAKIEKGLRSFARNSANGSMVPVPVSVNSILVNTAQFREGLAKKHKLTIKVIMKELDFTITCRQNQIIQSIQILLTNSAEAITKLPERWIELAIEKNANFVFISVMDSGLRIDKEVVEKMMMPFFSTKEVGDGAGMGLSIALGVVESHLGSLTYDEKSPHTKFTIQIPLG